MGIPLLVRWHIYIETDLSILESTNLLVVSEMSAISSAVWEQYHIAYCGMMTDRLS